MKTKDINGKDVNIGDYVQVLEYHGAKKGVPINGIISRIDKFGIIPENILVLGEDNNMPLIIPCSTSSIMKNNITQSEKKILKNIRDLFNQMSRDVERV